MLMQTVNEFRVRLLLTSVSPLLIREGRYSEEIRKDWARTPEDRKRMPHAIPISRNPEAEIKAAVCDPRAVEKVQGLEFYIPGSSLRGTWRSHLERTLRSLNPPETPVVCDPFLEDKAEPYQSCSSRLAGLRDELEEMEVAPEKRKPRLIPYSISCPVCKLFGSTMQAGRIRIEDGVRINPTQGRIVERQHVLIDRRSGQVAKGALYKFFGLLGATFQVDVSIQNFELWHLALVGSVLKDISLLPLGSGKNKGYGRVQGTVEDIRVIWFGTKAPDNRLRGVAENPDPARAEWYQQRYGLRPAAQLPELPQGQWDPVSPWRFERSLDWPQFEGLWKQISLPWDGFRPLSARTVSEVR